VTPADQRAAGEREGYRVDDATVDVEARRLAYLAEVFDPATLAVLDKLGVGPGWRCLEVGAGGGSIARALAARVRPGGQVLATDVDVRPLQASAGVGLEVREHDIVTDLLPAGAFDLVHARGVMQHLDRRDEALASMVRATRPGGWVVVEDADWVTFDAQPVAEPFLGVHQTMQAAYTEMSGFDRHLGGRLVPWLRAAGLEAVDADGHAFAMHGGQASLEWYVLGIERAAPRLAEAGLVDADTVAAALAQVRAPDFCVLSPLAVAAWGRRRS
jgi:SAM-dependent methyltransferase